jgi:hypothetical protein
MGALTFPRLSIPPLQRLINSREGLREKEY